jgi:hypothetical protein
MRMNPDAARCRPSLGINILIAEDSIGPRPAGTDHQRLEVVLAGKADRDGTVVLVVIIDLTTRHWAARDEIHEGLRRQRARIPVAVVARLSFLGSVDSEQADALTTKLHGVATRLAIRWREGACHISKFVIRRIEIGEESRTERSRASAGSAG